jgi:hypothetical protein
MRHANIRVCTGIVGRGRVIRWGKHLTIQRLAVPAPLPTGRPMPRQPMTKWTQPLGPCPPSHQSPPGGASLAGEGLGDGDGETDGLGMDDDVATADVTAEATGAQASQDGSDGHQHHQQMAGETAEVSNAVDGVGPLFSTQEPNNLIQALDMRVHQAVNNQALVRWLTGGPGCCYQSSSSSVLHLRPLPGTGLTSTDVATCETFTATDDRTTGMLALVS